MKTIVIMALATIVNLNSNHLNQNPDVMKVKQTIESFARYADEQNAELMATVLDDSYVTIANRLFGSETVSHLNKSTYLEMLKTKKIGGDKRKVDFKMVDVTDKNASVKVEMKGSKLLFTSYLLLAKDGNGTWKIVADMPYAVPVS